LGDGLWGETVVGDDMLAPVADDNRSPARPAIE
jgi:hypothetical protein